MPVINFKGADKVILGSEADKVYLGNEMMWEKKAISISIVLYTDTELSMFSKYLSFQERIDPRITKENIQKIVLMDKYEIQGDKVSSVTRNPNRITFTSDFNTLVGINDVIPRMAKVEVYLK